MEELVQKTYSIIVNGQQKTWDKKEISFDEVVNLAYNGHPPTGQDVMFTVTYVKGDDKKPKGTLLEGQSVRVKNGMIFDVTATNKS